MASSRVRSTSSRESSSDKDAWKELAKEPSEDRGQAVESGPAEVSGRAPFAVEEGGPTVVVGIEALEATRSSKGKLKSFKVPAAKEDAQSAVSSMNAATIDAIMSAES
jgi:hypothetical protein